MMVFFLVMLLLGGRASYFFPLDACKGDGRRIWLGTGFPQRSMPDCPRFALSWYQFAEEAQSTAGAHMQVM